MMESACVPIVPQWNLIGGSVCTPEGGFLYVAVKSINYIGPILSENEAPLMKVFHTRQPIRSIDVDPAWGKKPSEDHGNDSNGKKYFAVLAADNSTQIWDFDKSCVVSGHKAHVNQSHIDGKKQMSDQRVLLSYMCNRNVLTIDAQDVIVYCVASNTYCRRPTFISTRTQSLNVVRCCPVRENIFALGTSRGLVLICDLHSLQIVYTLRGHDSPITSLSWTSIRVNSTQSPKTSAVKLHKHEPKKLSQKPVADVTIDAAGTDDIFNIYDYEYLENEFGVPTDVTKKDCDSDSDFVGIEKPSESGCSTKFDFVEACENLKEDIHAIKTASPCKSDEVTLADCATKIQENLYLSDSCSENSITLSTQSSSGDGIVVDGERTKVGILHQAEVHASQTLDRKQKSNVEEETELNPEISLYEQKGKGSAETERDVLQIANPITQSNPKSNTLKFELNDFETDKEIEIDNRKEDGVVSEGDEMKIIPKHIQLEGDSAIDSSSSKFDILLSSAAQDGSFWVWNTIIGASCDSIKVRGGNNQNGKNFNSEVIWYQETDLIINNRYGELSYWTCQPIRNVSSEHIRRYKFKEEKKWFQPRRSIVGICVSKADSMLWCISSLREITCESLVNKKIVARFSCASTNISMLIENPHNMNKIAVGFSDRRVGVFDVRKFGPTNVQIDNYSYRVDSQVLCLAWSSDCERLAFGTSEGRVGIVHIENTKSTPYVFNPVCGKPIYSIDWHNNHIFIVCNEKIAVYTENSKNKDGVYIDGLKGVSTLSVRDGKLFVGTQNGHLQVYQNKSELTTSYELIADLEIAPRYISCLAWNPIDKDKLAVTSNSHIIQVVNFDVKNNTFSYYRKFEVEMSKVSHRCARWSNTNSNLLLTCGFDGAVRVWDLTNIDSPLKFIKQFPTPMNCGLFHPSDENIIICAGQVTSLEFIDMRAGSMEKCTQLKFNGDVSWAVSVLPISVGKSSSANKRQRPKRSLRTNAEVEEPSSEPIIDQMTKLKLDDQPKCATQRKVVHENIFMKDSTTVLYLTAKELNMNALAKLKYLLMPPNSNKRNKFLSEKLLGTCADAKQLLAEELKNYQHSKVQGICTLMGPLINGDIKEEIIKCTKNKQLTEWHVSLAPTISYNFWVKCCEAFAEQLMEAGHALQAATYLVAIHKQKEAVKALMEQNYHKEAMLIARVYLQREDSLFDEIIENWVKYLEFTGNLIAAALVCILSRQMTRAYELLCRVRNTQSDVEYVIKLLKENEHYPKN